VSLAFIPYPPGSPFPSPFPHVFIPLLVFLEDPFFVLSQNVLQCPCFFFYPFYFAPSPSLEDAPFIFFPPSLHSVGPRTVKASFSMIFPPTLLQIFFFTLGAPRCDLSESQLFPLSVMGPLHFALAFFSVQSFILSGFLCSFSLVQGPRPPLLSISEPPPFLRSSGPCPPIHHVFFPPSCFLSYFFLTLFFFCHNVIKSFF